MPPNRDPGPGQRGKGGKKDGKKGGKKGDGKKGGGKKNQNRNALYQRAVRDVQLGLDPLFDEIQRARDQAATDFGKSSSRVSEIYGALQNQLAPQTGMYNEAVGGYGEDLQNQIGGLASMLGSNVPGVPQEEIGAGTDVVGAIGAGGLSQLASDRARNAAYNTSAIRQGGIEQMNTSRNYLQDFQNFLSDLQQRRLDIKSDQPQMLKQRLDELRDQAFQRNMAKKEFGLRAAAAEAQGASTEAMRKWMMGQTNQPSGPGPGPRGPGPGPGPNNQGNQNQGNQNQGNINASRLINQLIGGDQRFRQLGDPQKQAVRSQWNDPAAGRVVDEYSRLFPNKPAFVGGPQDFTRLIKKVGKKRRRLASDPSSGPGR